ncbi:CBS domain-containing protein [Streptomyces sp. NPDC088707]|uniref:CBS domain-containing protein n=1 Tax=Streptomyces sp. NPDC088707 TaxID=3365871 RepID=UPI0037FA6F71
MTLFPMHVDSASSLRLHGREADAEDTAVPRVCDDMTVEVALSVMAGARTGYLLVCDDDGVCTGLVTEARLTTVRESPAYTDRLQLRDVPDDHGPLTSPAGAVGGHAPHLRLLTSPSCADVRDGAPGALALVCA